MGRRRRHSTDDPFASTPAPLAVVEDYLRELAAILPEHLRSESDPLWGARFEVTVQSPDLSRTRLRLSLNELLVAGRLEAVVKLILVRTGRSYATGHVAGKGYFALVDDGSGSEGRERTWNEVREGLALLEAFLPLLRRERDQAVGTGGPAEQA